ncbi:MAG: DUF4097 family beta strand repeat-containing protein [Gemmatimonadaceae bacterium]
MRNHLHFLALLAPIGLSAQQKVDVHRSCVPTVSVRLSGAFSSIRVTAWANDSISLTGSLGAGSRMDGGALNVSGPVNGVKFYVEAPDEAALRNNKLELRVPRDARVWIKTGSADIDVQGVAGGLDLNIVGGSIKVNGKPRELVAESMDGSVTFSGFAEYAKLKTATGDIVLQGGGDDLTLSTVSGSIQAMPGERTVQRMRFESVTGPITYAGEVTRGADLRFDTHSGAVELRLVPKANLEVDAASVIGAIENTWNSGRPIVGREGRGMELGTSSGMGGARVQVRSFKGNVRLATK